MLALGRTRFPKEQSDQGSNMSVSMILTSLKCSGVYAADVKADDIFQTKF